MLDMLVKFAACCRAWDLRVSTVEVLDCAGHLGISCLNSEDHFKTVLRANFAKSRRDQKKFEKIFDLYFHGRPMPGKSSKEVSVKPHIDEILNEIQNHAEKSELDHAIERFLEGDPSSFLNQVSAMQNAEEKRSLPIKSNLAQLSGKLQFMFAILKMKNRILSVIEKNNYDPKLKDQLVSHFSSALETAQELSNQEPGVYNDGVRERRAELPEETSISHRPFSSLSPGQIIEMRETVEQLARKLKDQVSRRYAAKSRGALDIKKTLRNAGKYQGVPIDIRFKAKAPKKSRIVALCDVSGSVWSTSRFMLHFLYALQECFSQIRSFIFISDLAEITDFFKDQPVGEALDNVMNHADINYNDYTDYGMAFQSFKDDYLSILNSRTTLIILGDGRTNYQNPQGGILSLFREKTRRIIWLNPEPAKAWFTGDSEMRTYKKHCHEIFTCMNLAHLEAFIRRIVV